MSELTDAVEASEPVAAEGDGKSLHLGWALVLICIAQLMVVLDATIANIALPYIGRDLHMSGTNLTWIVTGYALAFGGLLLLGGRLGDLYGRRRIFIIGLIDLRRRVAARRPRPERGAAADLTRPPGSRRRARLAGGARPDHDHLPGRAAP